MSRFSPMLRALASPACAILALAVSLVVLVPASSEARPFGYSAGGGLFLVDLADATHTELTGFGGIDLVTMDSERNLFLLERAHTPGLEYRLHLLEVPEDPLLLEGNPAEPPILLVGEIPNRIDAMTLGPDGDLLISAEEGLFRAAPATGQVTQIAPLQLESLASRDGVVFGTVRDPGLGTVSLFRVDLETGSLGGALPLPLHRFASAIAMDFDDAGALWVASFESVPIAPPQYNLDISRVDVETDQIERIFSTTILQGTDIPALNSLAILPPQPTVVAIPTLGDLGGLALALLLLLAGWQFLRRS